MASCSSAHSARMFYLLCPNKANAIKHVDTHSGCGFHGIHVPKQKLEFKLQQKRCRIECAKADTKQPQRLHGTSHFKDVSSKVVLVVGGTGGVGQLVVARLLGRGIKTCILIRDLKKAETLFGIHDADKLQTFTGDTRHPEELDSSIFEGVTHVICCTGTTAFPSRRWDGDNTPERTDWEGVRNLLTALSSSVKRFVLVSSIEVTKFDKLPWSIMNLFGVLKFKKMGEDFLRSSGVPFTVIRAGKLTDGPHII